MRLEEAQRRELAKALFDVGKLAFAITVATPMVTAGMRAWRVASLGVGFVVFAFLIATRLLKEVR